MATTIKVTDYESVKPNNEDILLLNQGGENKNTTVGNILEKVPNDNLLINGDFRNPVNTQGKTSYTSTSYDNYYTIDKWILFNKDTTLTLSDLGISTTSDTIINQKILKNEYKKLIGKNVTVSLGYYTTNSNIKPTLSFYDRISEETSSGSSKPLTLLNKGIEDLGNNHYVYHETFKNFQVNDVAYIEVVIQSKVGAYLEYAKLEIGSIATPFCPKSYIAELQNCLMYSGSEISTPCSNPNLIINGDFQVWQRGASINCVPGIQYTADRWAMWTTKSPTISKSSDGGYSMDVLGDGNDNLIHIVELATPNRGVNMTLSFLLKAPVGTTISVRVSNGTTINDSDKTKECGYDINGTGVWKKYYVKIPSDITRLSLMRVSFSMGNTCANQTIQFASVKLELGSIATPFVSRPYGEELALCQRYYQDIMTCGIPYDTNNLAIHTTYPVTMRITPTIKIVGNLFDIEGYVETVFTSSSQNVYNYYIGNIMSSDNNLTKGNHYQIHLLLDSEIY